MTNQFMWYEIGIFLLPFILILSVNYIKTRFPEVSSAWFLNKRYLLIPIWTLVIHLLSLLVFNFTLIPWMISLLAFAIFLDLRAYIQTIDEFDLVKYIPRIIMIVNIGQLFLGLGMMILRIWTYFR